MKYHTPLAWAFVALVLAAFFYEYFLKDKKRATLQVGSLRLLNVSSWGLRAQLTWLIPALKAFALFLVVMALARPQSASSKVNRTVEGIDIAIALDVSDSMYIEDMEPENRLGSAKDTISKFIKKRVSDRIGLVIFAGEAFTACPPTLDYEVLQKTLQDVRPEQIKQGTAIGVGLATAVARLKDSTAKTRVVILLTDGENNSGTIDPATATDMAKGYGLKVYTIGIGRDGQAQLPQVTTDAFGRKYKSYVPIHSSVNSQLLTNIAETTGGKYYRATDGDALKGVFSDIDRLEKTKIQTNQYTRYTENFAGYLLIAIFVYALQWVLGATWLRRAP